LKIQRTKQRYLRTRIFQSAEHHS